MELNYNLRRAIRREVGPYAETVFDVLAYHDDGSGIEIATSRIASESNLSEKTVRRAVEKLRASGWIKREEQFRNNRQVANRYQLATLIGGSPSDRAGGLTDQRNSYISTNNYEQEVVEEIDHKEVVVLPGQAPGTVYGEGRWPSLAEAPTPNECPDSASQDLPAASELSGEVVSPKEPHPGGFLWPPRNSPMPMSAAIPAGCGKNLLDDVKEALWLVSYFEGYQVQRTNQRRIELGWKLVEEFDEDRKLTWFHPALALVRAHGLLEVVSVVDWIFGTHSGLLPYQVKNRFSHTFTTRDRKLTNLRQLEFHFDRLVEEVANPECTGVVEPTDFTNQVTRDSTGGVNYGQRFSNPDEEAKVTELVALFAEFRSKVGVITEFPAQRTWSWAKSFRIMLASRGYEFDDLRMVITTLRDCSETGLDRFVDVNRYMDAYDLQRDGWDYLRSTARLVVRMTEARRRTSLEHRPEGRSASLSAHSKRHWEDSPDRQKNRPRWEEEDDDDIDFGVSQRDMMRRLMGSG